MHFSYWMVLVAMLLPYVTLAGAKAQKGYDNADPRLYLAKLQGWRARANAAHLNHFEAFPAFAAAVIIAQLKGAPQHHIDMLAAIFVGVRVIYTFTYLLNVAPLRTLVWMVGLGTVVCLMVT